MNTQMRRKKATYLELHYSQGASHHPLNLAELKAGRGVGKFHSEKSEGFRYAPMGGRYPEKAEGGRIKKGASCGLGSIFGFLCLVLSWKQRQTLGKLALID